jgi:hypothetical protein
MWTCCLPLKPNSKDKEEKKGDIQLQENRSALSFENQVCLAYCVKVTDGDTVQLNIRTALGVYLFRVRLANLDCPETRSRDPEEKSHGLACKQLMERLLLHRNCVIKCGAFDKYGRLLGDVYVTRPTLEDNEITETTPLHTLVHLNSQMVQWTSSVEYKGGSHVNWKQQFQQDREMKKQYHKDYLFT